MSNHQADRQKNEPIRRIQPLPAWLVNKIAAGEVIERPASCVKELIENSIDAGATEISIAVSQGGRKLIRISDNGHGIFARDLSLLFKSHSTSKIAREDDLYNIKTLGFRGEALASMASIAKIRLVSKTAIHPEAYEISVNEGEVAPPRPAAGVNGTSIEITDLFYQTPARRKFLKSDGVELSHISETVTRFAIAYPEISFKLLNLPDMPTADNTPPPDKKFLINLNGIKDDFPKSFLERLAFFYGSATSEELLHAAENNNDISLKVLFSDPTQTRPNSKLQFFYLNRRFIRDRILSRAIYQAYHNLIPYGRHPFITLFIQLPTSAFDVNVHPTKIEVRFREAWKIHDQIISLIRGRLSRLPAPETNQTESYSDLRQTPAEPLPPQPENQRAMQAIVDFFANKPESPRVPFYPHSHLPDDNAPEIPTPTLTPAQNPEPATIIQTALSGRNIQIHNSYIISETPDGIIIIDQHALHERILYNRFSRQIAAAEVYRQKFLIPILVEIPKSKAMMLPEIIPFLKKAGIEAEEFGERTISVQSAPPLLNKVNFTDFILEFIDSFADDSPEQQIPGENHIQPIDKLIKLMACKAAIKAGDPLTREEMTALLSEAGKMEFVTCPHGRPAVHKINLSELNHYFQR
jgi:DNA mismatch repair protein MutL